jgi:hypothetical protein
VPSRKRSKEKCAPEEPHHAPDVIPPEKDHGPRHARVQARRTQERRGGKGGKVKSRRQAIAIALKEAGASKYENKDENKRNLAKSERKEARGETYQQEREGKSRVGARGRRESSRGMGGMDATRTTAKGRKAPGRGRVIQAGQPNRSFIAVPKRVASRAVRR